MLDHIVIFVSDYFRSKRFFEAALAPLGYKLITEDGMYGAGFGHSDTPNFWIKQGRPCLGLHVAFSTDNRKAVDAFYEAAIAAGASDHGGPPICREYHPTYYGGFVLDPDGHNIEAVCHSAE